MNKQEIESCRKFVIDAAEALSLGYAGEDYINKHKAKILGLLLRTDESIEKLKEKVQDSFIARRGHLLPGENLVLRLVNQEEETLLAALNELAEFRYEKAKWERTKEADMERNCSESEATGS